MKKLTEVELCDNEELVKFAQIIGQMLKYTFDQTSEFVPFEDCAVRETVWFNCKKMLELIYMELSLCFYSHPDYRDKPQIIFNSAKDGKQIYIKYDLLSDKVTFEIQK